MRSPCSTSVLALLLIGCAATTVGPARDSGVRDAVVAVDAAPARDVATVMDAPDVSTVVDAPDVATFPDLGVADAIDATVDVGGDGGCPVGMTACDGTCVDLMRDPNNCGVCGAHCCSDSCMAGTCFADGPGLSLCSPGPGGCVNEAVNLEIDPANCGACGHACCLGSVCAGGRCVYSCGAPLTTCGIPCVDGRCTNLYIDPSNCGMCGNICPSGSLCSMGACTALPVDAGRNDAAASDATVPAG